MKIEHAHNMTTKEFIQYYEHEAKTPLEVELMRRVINLEGSEELEEENTDLAESVEILTDRKGELEEENSDLQQDLDEAERMIASLENEVAALEKELDNCENEPM